MNKAESGRGCSLFFLLPGDTRGNIDKMHKGVLVWNVQN